MNARIRQLSALAAAMALAVPAAAFAQDTTTEKLDQIEQDTSPPPVSDIDDNMEPIDPEVDAMTQPPRQADDTDAMDDSADSQDPLHDDSDQEQMREYRAASEPGLWAQLDTNGDGRVSREEGRVNADFSANFEMIDADGDGFVTDAEFTADAHGGVEDEENDEW